MARENEGEFLTERPQVRKTKMRLSIYIFILATALFCACESPKEAPAPQTHTAENATPTATQTTVTSPAKPPRIDFIEGPQPGPDDVLGTFNGFDVTVGDFERAVHLGSLFAPNADKGEFPLVAPEKLAAPSVQFSTAHAVLSRKVVANEIARRKIEITRKEIEELYHTDPQYKGFAWLLDHPEERPKVLEKLHLSEDDFYSVGQDGIARQKLSAQLIDEISDEEIWNAWAFEHNTVSIAAVAAPNIPTSNEIDEFVEKYPDKIKTFFEANAKRFRQPRRVIVDAVVANNQGHDKLLDAMKQLQDGKEVMEIALATGLEAQHSVRMIRQENNKAFQGQVGDVGLETSGPRGTYAWRVIGFEESETAELNRGLMREIAAELLRTSKPTASVKKRMTNARQALAKIGKNPTPEKIARAQEALAKQKLELKVLRDFRNDANGSIPIYGLAPEVLDAAFKLTSKRPTSPLILSRENVFVIHLLDRKKPDRKAFEAEKESWSNNYRQQARQTIVDRFVQNTVGNPAMNLRPLGIRYGVLTKE